MLLFLLTGKEVENSLATDRSLPLSYPSAFPVRQSVD